MFIQAPEIRLFKTKEDRIYILDNVTLAYPKLFEPDGMPGEDKSYSVEMLIPKSCPKVETLKGIFESYGKNSYGVDASPILPLKDGDNQLRADGTPVENPRSYKFGHYVMRAKAHLQSRPILIDAEGRFIVNESGMYQQQDDTLKKSEALFYHGCIGKVWFQLRSTRDPRYGKRVYLGLISVAARLGGTPIRNYRFSDIQDAGDEVSNNSTPNTDVSGSTDPLGL